MAQLTRGLPLSPPVLFLPKVMTGYNRAKSDTGCLVGDPGQEILAAGAKQQTDQRAGRCKDIVAGVEQQAASRLVSRQMQDTLEGAKLPSRWVQDFGWSGRQKSVSK